MNWQNEHKNIKIYKNTNTTIQKNNTLPQDFRVKKILINNKNINNKNISNTTIHNINNNYKKYK